MVSKLGPGLENELKKRICSEVEKAVYIIPPELKKRIALAHDNSSGLEKKVLGRIIENIEIASENKISLCQDTGVYEIWVDIGVRSPYNKVNLTRVIEEAVASAHKGGIMRSSMDEIKPVVNFSFSDSSRLDFIMTPRGFGSENYTFLHMMPPESSFESISDRIVEDIKSAGGRPCPPYLVGVGIGGTATKAVELSARALAEMDFEDNSRQENILKRLNNLGVGAGAVGGSHTALGIKIKKFPKHIAGLPLCVRAGCWCNRTRRFRVE